MTTLFHLSVHCPFIREQYIGTRRSNAKSNNEYEYEHHTLVRQLVEDGDKMSAEALEG